MNENYSSTPRSLSFVDLKLVPGAVGVMERNNKKEVDTLLWQLGFDTRYGVEFVECNHRALSTNQAVFGIRVEGLERCDKEWIESGLASTEVRIESCKDKTLRDELLKLNKQGCADKSMVDERVAKSVVNKEKRG